MAKAKAKAKVVPTKAPAKEQNGASDLSDSDKVQILSVELQRAQAIIGEKTMQVSRQEELINGLQNELARVTELLKGAES